MQTSPCQCYLCVALIFILMDFTCTTEQEDMNWCQGRTGSHPRAAASPREHKAAAGRCQLGSPGHSRSGQAEQGLRRCWGALPALPFSRPSWLCSPGHSKELSFASVSSSPSSVETRGMGVKVPGKSCSLNENTRLIQQGMG